MPEECTEVQEWLEEEIWKPVEQWVEERHQECKQYPWWNPLGWVCWFVTVVVLAVVWIVVKVGKWVVRIVCKVVSAIIQALFDVLGGLAEIVMGFVKGDLWMSLHGLVRALLGLLNLVFTLFRVFFQGETVDYIVEEVNRHELRDYVRTLLEAKYSGDELQKIKDKLHLDHGYFGYRIPIHVISTYLDSETPSPDEPGVPNLVKLHEGGKINLRELCGFEFPGGFLNRKRYSTRKKNVIVRPSRNPFRKPVSAQLTITKGELETYLSSRGNEGPKFIILCMQGDVLKRKMRTAELKARELGLIPQLTEDSLEVKLPEYIIHDGTSPGLTRFLVNIVGRKRNTDRNRGAFDELCKPVAVGVFGFLLETHLRGIAACLAGSPCLGGPADTSGVTFADCLPDMVWKYVLIHELGHYFGLCHVDGVDRIMFARKRMIDWWTLPKLVYLKGEPSFTLDEAKQVWDYIVAHFPSHCLTD